MALIGNIFSNLYGHFSEAWGALFRTSFVWLPLAFLYGFWHMWLYYRQSDFIKNNGGVLLEIKLPKEISKSPVGMEIIFTTFVQSAAVTFYDAFVKGYVKPWFSLEMASFEGQIHFYIWTRLKYRNLIEAQIYAQYPSVEIHEARDYTLEMRRDPNRRSVWGTYFKLTKPDPYPIKTYVDYGLDKDPKEEFKTDPLTAVLEYLGSMRKGEQAWIQILVQHHKQEWLKDGRLFKKKDWQSEAKELVDELMKRKKKPAPGERLLIPELTLTKAEKTAVDAIERSVGKYAYNVMIRGMYIAENEAFDNAHITGLIGSVRQYNSQDLNGFKLGWYTDYSDAMKDWFKIIPGLRFALRHRRAQYEHHMLDAYKRRSFFATPHKNYEASPFVLSSEELATIFHFPGAVAATPTLSRVVSKKGEPPANLPTGTGTL